MADTPGRPLAKQMREELAVYKDGGQQKADHGLICRAPALAFLQAKQANA